MPVENVTFSNITIEAEKGFSCSNARNLAFRDVQISTKKGPALLCEKVEGLEIHGLRTLTPHEGTAVVNLKNVVGAYLRDCRRLHGGVPFLQVQGKDSQRILVQASELDPATAEVKRDEDVPASALVPR
jgi:hypothetical protein